MFNSAEIMLDIGNYNTKVLYYKKLSKKISIIDFKMFRTPANLFSDDNDLQLVPEFVDLLKDTLKQMGVKSKSISFTISSSGIIVRNITLPVVDDKILKGMVDFALPQNFLVDLKDFVVDYKVMGKTTENGEEKYSVMLSAASLHIIESYLKMAETLKLNINTIDFTNNSITNLINTQIKLENEALTCAFVDIGHINSNISICRGNELEYNRSLMAGCVDFINMIKNSEECPVEKAEEFLKKYKFFDKNRNLSDADLETDNKMRYVGQHFVSELTRVFEFYYSRKVGNKIDLIVLSGGGSNINGIVEYFQNEFSIDTTLMPVFENVNAGKSNQDFLNNSVFYANCVGAASVDYLY